MSNVQPLTHIDLFSGIGGFALAARWAGIKTIQFVEIDKFCQKVLAKNFPGVPIHDDIKTFTNCKSYGLEERGMAQHRNKRGQSSRDNDNVATFTESGKSGEPSEQEGRKNIGGGNSEGRPFLLTGGFPCQPFSCAGKRRGKEDDRYLWEEMLRVIKEFKPTWIIGENVNGIRSMEFQDGVSDLEGDTVIQEDGDNGYTNVLDGICNSLEAIGYEVQPIIIPACAVNAPHRRDRVWIIANSTSGRCFNGCGDREERHFQDSSIRTVEENKSERNRRLNRIKQTDSHAPDPMFIGQQGQGKYSSSGDTEKESHRKAITITSNNTRESDACNSRSEGLERSGDTEWSNNAMPNRGQNWSENWLEAATRLCGIFNGLSEWMDRNTGELNAKITNAITGQDMPHLWDGFQSEAFQWSSGRFNTIHEKENLFAVLWKLFGESNRQDNLSFESATVQEAFLRNVWSNGKSGCTPQRWEYNEQYGREHRDSLSSMSHEIASLTAEITNGYGRDRVHRLKALGNAIVPQVAYEIIKSIVEFA